MEYGIIVRGIPDWTIPKEVGLIWEISAWMITDVMERLPIEENNKRVITELYYPRLFDGFELSVADEIIAPDFYNDSHPEWERGPEGIKAVVRMLHAPLSNLHMEIHILIAEGSYVFAYTTQTGIHDKAGHLMGKEPDGSQFAQMQGHLFTFNEEGRVIQHNVMRDDKVTSVNVEGRNVSSS